MVGQGKTIQQAEIDASCELIDFYRFGAQYAMDVYNVCDYQFNTMNIAGKTLFSANCIMKGVLCLS